jgi:hypothetical protein
MDTLTDYLVDSSLANESALFVFGLLCLGRALGRRTNLSNELIALSVMLRSSLIREVVLFTCTAPNSYPYIHVTTV